MIPLLPPCRYDATFKTGCTKCSYPAKYQTQADNRRLTCLDQTKCNPGFFLKQINPTTLEGECTNCPANQYQVTSLCFYVRRGARAPLQRRSAHPLHIRPTAF